MCSSSDIVPVALENGKVLDLADLFVTGVWSESCNAHDLCYNDCSQNQASCDLQWKKDANKECEEHYGGWFSWFYISYCKTKVSAVYMAINPEGLNLAGEAYHEAMLYACTCED